jgi:acyl-CoA thioesterase-1
MLKITQLIMDRARDAHSKIPVMVFYGDSVTQGCFEITPEAGNNPRDMEAVYHHRLKKMIQARYPGIEIKVINAGVGGDSAPVALKRMERDVLSHSPDFCVVCFGLNDTFGGKAGLKRYANALGKMFDRLAAAGCETVFMTPNMMNTYVSPKMEKDLYYRIARITARYQTGGRMDAYMDTARATAAAHGVPVCDGYARWKELAANGLDVTEALANSINHPTREMHALFAVELYKMIFPR